MLKKVAFGLLSCLVLSTGCKMNNAKKQERSSDVDAVHLSNSQKAFAELAEKEIDSMVLGFKRFFLENSSQNFSEGVTPALASLTQTYRKFFVQGHQLAPVTVAEKAFAGKIGEVQTLREMGRLGLLPGGAGKKFFLEVVPNVSEAEQTGKLIYVQTLNGEIHCASLPAGASETEALSRLKNLALKIQSESGAGSGAQNSLVSGGTLAVKAGKVAEVKPQPKLFNSLSSEQAAALDNPVEAVLRSLAVRDLDQIKVHRRLFHKYTISSKHAFKNGEVVNYTSNGYKEADQTNIGILAETSANSKTFSIVRYYTGKSEEFVPPVGSYLSTEQRANLESVCTGKFSCE